MTPVGDRVYVKVNVSEEKSAGGLLLPVSSQKKPTQGEVVGAGTAKAVKVRADILVAYSTMQRSLDTHIMFALCFGHSPRSVMQNGDKVVYSKYAGTDLKVSGDDYVLLKVRECYHCC